MGEDWTDIVLVCFIRRTHEWEGSSTGMHDSAEATRLKVWGGAVFKPRDKKPRAIDSADDELSALR